MHFSHGAPAPWELFVWQLAERFGWTLEYIESLPMARWHEFLLIEDARSKARETARMKD